MPKIPEVRPKTIEKILLKLGFVMRQGKGSHVVFSHADGRRTVLAKHNQPVRIGTLKAILRQIEMTTEEFLRYL